MSPSLTIKSSRRRPNDDSTPRRRARGSHQVTAYAAVGGRTSEVETDDAEGTEKTKVPGATVRDVAGSPSGRVSTVSFEVNSGTPRAGCGERRAFSEG